MSPELLKIENLHASIEGKEILKGIDLSIQPGEVHAIMGPNGSGKSTLANVLMGHPHYEVTRGKIFFKGEEITGLAPEARAQRGLFLSFQYPIAIPGVTVANLLMTSLMTLAKTGNGRYAEIRKTFRTDLKKNMELLKIDPAFVTRSLNDGFSGGEKKRMEILQLLALQPTLAVLDETDSGLDIDALKIVSEGMQKYLNPERSALVITHYQRLLSHLKADRVHILGQGTILTSGGPELAIELESKGYKTFGLEDAV